MSLRGQPRTSGSDRRGLCNRRSWDGKSDEEGRVRGNQGLQFLLPVPRPMVPLLSYGALGQLLTRNAI